MGPFLIFFLTFIFNGYSKEIPGSIKDFYRIAEEIRDDILCYDELGCFSDGAPFDEPYFERLYSAEPNSPEDIGIEFRYYAPESKKTEVLNIWNVPQHINRDSGFRTKLKAYFIVHGFLGGNAPWAVDLKDALMQKEPCHVFIVDWTGGDGPVYPKAVANIRVVGASVGLFIHRLMNGTGFDPQNVHIIGHSLGSHASGYAGKWLKDKTKQMVGRITGLDPAGPYFNGVDRVVRLDIGDASFVDAIHTNWANSMFSGFGLYEAIGHFDFYPNGGEDQPGCPTASEAEVEIAEDFYSYLSPLFASLSGNPADTAKEDIEGLSCSHGRAYEYFIHSLEDEACSFYSTECSSWENYIHGDCRKGEQVQMGFYADKYKYLAKGGRQRKFFLRTSATPPYCLEQTS